MEEETGRTGGSSGEKGGAGDGVSGRVDPTIDDLHRLLLERSKQYADQDAEVIAQLEKLKDILDSNERMNKYQEWVNFILFFILGALIAYLCCGCKCGGHDDGSCSKQFP